MTGGVLMRIKCFLYLPLGLGETSLQAAIEVERSYV
jgi:hypothetical protein